MDATANNYARAHADEEKRIGQHSEALSRPAVVLPPPGDLTAEPGAGQVTLRWQPVAGAMGYFIQRSESPNGPFERILQLANVAGPGIVQEDVHDARRNLLGPLAGQPVFLGEVHGQERNVFRPFPQRQQIFCTDAGESRTCVPEESAASFISPKQRHGGPASVATEAPTTPPHSGQ